MSGAYLAALFFGARIYARLRAVHGMPDAVARYIAVRAVVVVMRAIAQEARR